MRNNQINQGKCCPVEIEQCIPEKLSVCGESAREAYEEYLKQEACKPEPEQCIGNCDFDWSEVYFMQYRSKQAFYNEWWKKDLYKDIYNIKGHKYKKNSGGT